MGPGGHHRPFGLLGLRAWWKVEGGWIADGDEDLAMVGKVAAKRYAVGLGDTITLTTDEGERTVTVAGLFTSGDEQDEAIIVPLATAQALAAAPGEVSRLEVSALTTPDNDLARRAARNPASLTTREMETWYCTAYVSAIAYQIEEVMSDAVAKPVRQVAESEGAVLGKTRLLMLLVTALSLAAAALGIANLVTASVIERAPEIGLLKAIGARDGGVVALVLVEMGLVALVGGVVGYAAGLGCAQVVGQVVFGSGVAIRPMAAGMTAALVALVLVVGCLPAIRSLIRLRPADVLQGR
jgi:putative ABC transport system permease protein